MVREKTRNAGTLSEGEIQREREREGEQREGGEWGGEREAEREGGRKKERVRERKRARDMCHMSRHSFGMHCFLHLKGPKRRIPQFHGEVLVFVAAHDLLHFGL